LAAVEAGRAAREGDRGRLRADRDERAVDAEPHLRAAHGAAAAEAAARQAVAAGEGPRRGAGAGSVMRSLALVLLLASLAFAQEDAPEKQQARVLLGQGNALFERGDLKGALADFRAAYALFPSPKLLVNAAAAERELGDLPAAANDLRRFLDEADQEDPF